MSLKLTHKSLGHQTNKMLMFIKYLRSIFLGLFFNRKEMANTVGTLVLYLGIFNSKMSELELTCMGLLKCVW